MLNKVVDLERDKLREMPDIGHDLPIFARGRLTLEPGEPDFFGVPAKVTILHFSPYVGCYEFTEIDLPLGGYAANTNFDIFYKNHVLYSEAWATSTIRNVAIARVQGYLSHAADDQKRFVGTIRTTGVIGNTEDSVTKRFVSNYYNRIWKPLELEETTSHTYNGAYRLWNNSDASNLLGWLVCQPNGAEQTAHTSSLLKAGADGSYAGTALYVDGVIYPLFCGARNFNDQYINDGDSKPIYSATGYHYSNLYEISDHADSRFFSMRMSVMVEV